MLTEEFPLLPEQVPSAIEMSVEACEYGADALLLVTPYYNKTSQAGLIAHYTAIHDATDKPIILYNVPSRTGLNIKPETALELSKLPRINGIKEASGDLDQIFLMFVLRKPTISWLSILTVTKKLQRLLWTNI